MKLLRLNLLIIFVVLGSNKVVIASAKIANLRKKYTEHGYKASVRTIRRDLERAQAKNEKEDLRVANKAKKRGRKMGWPCNCLRDLIKKTFGC